MLLWRINKRFFHAAQSHFVRNSGGRDPGVSKRVQIFDDDKDFKKSLEDEEDFGDLDSDFSNTSSSYGDHKR